MDNNVTVGRSQNIITNKTHFY